MRMTMFAVSMVLGAALAACGSSGKSGVDANGGGDDVDAKVFLDAPPQQTTNALGQLCPFAAGGGGTMCPAGNDCVALMGVGSTTTGYCTPMCMNMSSICTTGYTGPAGGNPQCALTVMGSTTPNGCAIICTMASQCPTGMGCMPVTGQTVKICAPM